MLLFLNLFVFMFLGAKVHIIYYIGITQIG